MTVWLCTLFGSRNGERQYHEYCRCPDCSWHRLSKEWEAWVSKGNGEAHAEGCVCLICAEVALDAEIDAANKDVVEEEEHEQFCSCDPCREKRVELFRRQLPGQQLPVHYREAPLCWCCGSAAGPFSYTGGAVSCLSCSRDVHASYERPNQLFHVVLSCPRPECHATRILMLNRKSAWHIVKELKRVKCRYCKMKTTHSITLRRVHESDAAMQRRLPHAILDETGKKEAIPAVMWRGVTPEQEDLDPPEKGKNE